ncbi:MAG: CDP-alcohol phosphatidyltransferase family protein [Deltaproteobacteria bacterium]|nr:CDP-alcohol phosphatidyltransferase family protein [Deltaproteobacteria bacterium]MBW2500084.1 CDP-alcohol phosphatidyltransferase family protein [Deltaproteobacteria bacterium]
MIKEKLEHRIDGWIHTLFPFLFWRPVNPDWLTVVGTLVSGAAGLAFAEGELRLGGWLLVAGGFFDLVDGVVARHFGISTRFGAFLDSSMDRVADILALVGLVVFYVGSGERGLSALCVLILVASVLTSYAKARAELVLERMPGGLLERGERVGLLAGGALLGILPPILWLLAVGTVVTVAQRFLYAYREMGRLDRMARDSETGEAS